MPLVTPAFQSNGSAELQQFLSLREPAAPSGATRGAMDNINDSVSDLVGVFLKC